MDTLVPTFTAMCRNTVRHITLQQSEGQSKRDRNTAGI